MAQTEKVDRELSAGGVSTLPEITLKNLLPLMRISGRANRALYWKTYLLNWGGLIVAAFIFLVIHSPSGNDFVLWKMVDFIIGVLFFVSFVSALWIMLAVSIRRLHDRNRSGLWIIPLVIVPMCLNAITRIEARNLTSNADQPGFLFVDVLTLVLSIWWMIELGCLAGTAGSNRFGSDPLAGQRNSPALPDETQLATVGNDIWSQHNVCGVRAFEQGDYVEAEEWHKSALIEAGTYGPEDPRLAISLNNLAELYRALGKHAEAADIQARANAIRAGHAVDRPVQ